jgi:hypothetical protein
MSDSLYIVVILVVAIGGLIGVAYLLDQRGKKRKPLGPTLPEPEPLSRIFLWIARILVGIMVLAVVAAIVYKSLPLIELAGGGLSLYILTGLIYRIVRINGK